MGKGKPGHAPYRCQSLIQSILGYKHESSPAYEILNYNTKINAVEK